MTRLTRFSFFPVLVIGGAWFATLAFGQRNLSTSPTTTTPGTNSPNRGLPGNNPNNNPTTPSNYPPGTNPQQTPYPDQTRPIFISGRVMMDDGTPPPEPVTIMKVCNGNGRA